MFLLLFNLWFYMHDASCRITVGHIEYNDSLLQVYVCWINVSVDGGGWGGALWHHLAHSLISGPQRVSSLWKYDSKSCFLSSLETWSIWPCQHTSPLRLCRKPLACRWRIVSVVAWFLFGVFYGCGQDLCWLACFVCTFVFIFFLAVQLIFSI